MDAQGLAEAIAATLEGLGLKTQEVPLGVYVTTPEGRHYIINVLPDTRGKHRAT